MSACTRNGRRRRSALVLAPLVAVTLTLAACGGSGAEGSDDETTNDGAEPAEDALRVAFVHVGPTTDGGWDSAHERARQEMVDALGDQVVTTSLESIPDGPDSLPVFRDLARDGYDLIFGTTFGYQEPMAEVAAEFPDTIFMQATGSLTAENMSTYQVAAHEASYLAGMAAGGAAENGQIGFVSAFPIPEVLRVINAYALGAREVNPEATVRVVWTSDWNDPPRETQAAETLANAGVQVVGQYQSSAAIGGAAQDQGINWTGSMDDMSTFAPDAWLTGPMRNWGTIYTRAAQAVLDGTWESEELFLTMADGAVDIAPFGPDVPQDLQDRILAKREEIIDGSFQMFEGPIVNSQGEVVIAEGEVPTLEDLLGTDYFVEGVEGTLSTD